jgi:hypothetical protein
MPNIRPKPIDHDSADRCFFRSHHLDDLSHDFADGWIARAVVWDEGHMPDFHYVVRSDGRHDIVRVPYTRERKGNQVRGMRMDNARRSFVGGINLPVKCQSFAGAITTLLDAIVVHLCKFFGLKKSQAAGSTWIV